MHFLICMVKKSMATLYIVGTPIGNLEDVTFRAIRILKEVDVILCEDTRVTKRLLERYVISGKRLSTYNEERSGVAFEKICEWVEDDMHIALVSDAGTPGISDPGSHLVKRLREQFSNEKLSIVSVPGPSALTAGFSVSGIAAHDFLFLGFLPHKKGRETLFKEISDSTRTIVFYESPHRLLKTLTSLTKFVGADRKIVVARELTKIYEEIISGSAKEVSDFFEKNHSKVRGEFVLFVEGVSKKERSTINRTEK